MYSLSRRQNDIDCRTKYEGFALGRDIYPLVNHPSVTLYTCTNLILRSRVTVSCQSFSTHPKDETEVLQWRPFLHGRRRRPASGWQARDGGRGRASAARVASVASARDGILCHFLCFGWSLSLPLSIHLSRPCFCDVCTCGLWGHRTNQTIGSKAACIV